VEQSFFYARLRTGAALSVAVDPGVEDGRGGGRPCGMRAVDDPKNNKNKTKNKSRKSNNINNNDQKKHLKKIAQT
jgi:hypothetical protein